MRGRPSSAERAVPALAPEVCHRVLLGLSGHVPETRTTQKILFSTATGGGVISQSRGLTITTAFLPNCIAVPKGSSVVRIA
jgi:hypothetical protein